MFGSDSFKNYLKGDVIKMSNCEICGKPVSCGFVICSNECLNSHKVLGDIKAERLRQDTKLGEQNHEPEKWMSILGEEYGELCQAVNETIFDNGPVERQKGGYENMRKEAIHVAAVATAFIECLDRRNEKIMSNIGFSLKCKSEQLVASLKNLNNAFVKLSKRLAVIPPKKPKTKLNEKGRTVLSIAILAILAVIFIAIAVTDTEAKEVNHYVWTGTNLVTVTVIEGVND